MTERFQNASFQPEMLYEEICGYLDMVRQLVYRQDGQGEAFTVV